MEYSPPEVMFATKGTVKRREIEKHSGVGQDSCFKRAKIRSATLVVIDRSFAQRPIRRS